MFYCEPCAEWTGWPETVSRSRGRCEVCGEAAVCNDRKSSDLPRPKRAGPRPTGFPKDYSPTRGDPLPPFCISQRREDGSVCGLPRNHGGAHSWDRRDLVRTYRVQVRTVYYDEIEVAASSADQAKLLAARGGVSEGEGYGFHSNGRYSEAEHEVLGLAESIDCPNCGGSGRYEIGGMDRGPCATCENGRLALR